MADTDASMTERAPSASNALGGVVRASIPAPLHAYVVQGRAAGMREVDMRSDLARVGWPMDAVNTALAEIPDAPGPLANVAPPLAPPPHPRQAPLHLMVGWAVIGVLVAGGVIAAMRFGGFFSPGQEPPPPTVTVSPQAGAEPSASPIVQPTPWPTAAGSCTALPTGFERDDCLTEYGKANAKDIGACRALTNDRDRALCTAGVAEVTGETAHCRSVRGEEAYRCIARVAADAGDYGTCTQGGLSVMRKELCEAGVAVARGEKDACAALGIAARDMCALGMALQAKDASFCMLASGETEILACKFAVAIAADDLAACESATTTAALAWRDGCVTAVAAKRKNSGLCSWYITQADSRDRCYNDVGRAARDAAVCRIIVNEIVRTSCLAAVGAL